MKVSPELHLFIVWNHALPQAGPILEDMKRQFTIRRVYEMRWSDRRFSDNMSRFYGQKLPRNSGKELHCGRGAFLAAVVVDEHPEYQERQTSRGTMRVNVKCFDAKQRYRAWTGGGHRIHATNSPAETDHDLMLLLGQSAEEFLDAQPGAWDGNVEAVERDLIGAEGWPDISELFRALNASATYAVLRNFEGLPEAATLPGHGDIDLLCASSRETAFIANGERVFPDAHRVLYRIQVGGKSLLFDFREVGDDYYDPQWQQDMLQRRMRSARGFFHLCDVDHFYSLLYHAAVHKPAISADYAERLISMAPEDVGLTQQVLDNPDDVRAVLQRFMAEHGYSFVEPRDASVYFNAALAGTPKVSAARILQSSTDTATVLERIFEQSNDCSLEAPEFAGTLFRMKRLVHHFSPNRAMFLEALDLPRNASVLEMGAHSGVLTRWLGDRFDSVTALEARPEFYKVVAARCRTLAGVRIVDQTAEAFDAQHRTNAGLDKGFDVAIAIMDATVRRSKPESVVAAIQCARRSLNKTGLFILGIGSDMPIPALRDDIVQQLRSNGFAAIQVAYAFPNVILPRVVFSGAGVQSARKSFGYWAAFGTRDSGVTGSGEFEAAAASVRGALDSVATGCYILAARTADAMPEIRWEAWATSSETRHPSFRSTTVVLDDGGGPIVRKRGTPKEAGIFRFNPVAECPLYEGHTESAALLYALRTGNLDQFMTLLKLHVQHLSREFGYTDNACPPLLTEGDMLLRGEALDAIPQNTVLHEGGYRAFDLEWSVAIPLPLSYVLYRGLSVLLMGLRPDVVCKVFRLQQYGVPETPQLQDICVFFVNGLRIFPALQDRTIQHMLAFERRFAEFAGTGMAPAHGATLFELYQAVVGAVAENRDEDAMAALGRLQAAYPDAPETGTLTASLNEAPLDVETLRSYAESLAAK